MTSDPAAHLDDEAVSAVLDGEGTEEEARHVASCDRCADRLAVLRGAAEAVAAPVAPIDPGRLDAAVAAALSAQNVVPISVARRRPVPAWIGAAAAVAAVVAGVGLLGRGSDGSDDGLTAAPGAGSASDPSTMAMEESAGSTGGAPAVIDGGDVGELRDADLQVIVDGAMTQRETAVADSVPSGGGSAAATDADALAPTPAATGGPVACEAEVRAGNPDLGGLLYAARGTYDGDPVQVLVFDAGPTRWAYVTTVDGCEIRSSTTWTA